MYPVIFGVLIDFGVLSNMTPDYYQMVKNSRWRSDALFYSLFLCIYSLIKA